MSRPKKAIVEYFPQETVNSLRELVKKNE